jgi:hypothetical protein
MLVGCLRRAGDEVTEMIACVALHSWLSVYGPDLVTKPLQEAFSKREQW